MSSQSLMAGWDHPQVPLWWPNIWWRNGREIRSRMVHVLLKNAELKKVVRNVGLMWVVYLLPIVKEMSGARLLLKTMFESMTLWHLESVLMSVAHVVTRGHTDACGLGYNLCVCWCLKIMPPGTCQSELSLLPYGAIVLSWPRLLPRDISGPVALQYPSS